MSDYAQTLQLNNYISVVITTAVVYDYIITLPREINYIWNQPWTWVSVLFGVVRYVGLCVALLEALYGSSFIPGPTLTCVSTPLRICSTYAAVDTFRLGTVLIFLMSWGFVPFLAAADLVMILRVQAMYRGSKLVLGALLLFYVPTIILLVISTGFYNNLHTNLSVSTSQTFDFVYCNAEYTSLSGLNLHAFIPRFLLSGLMVILAVARLITESIQIYKATKQWLPNRYINLLVKESVFYFLAHLLYNIDAAVVTAESSTLGVSGLILSLFAFISLYTLAPRFILSVRELYARDSCRCWRRVPGIDTGFKFSERSRNSMTDVGSRIRFADAEALNMPERTSEIMRR